MTTTPTPEEMQDVLDQLRLRFTSETLCKDIHNAAVDNTLRGFDAVKELFKSQGKSDNHPAMKGVEDQIAWLNASRNGLSANIRSAADVRADTLAEILRKHGHANATPDTAHTIAHTLPRCWQEVQPAIESEMVRIGIQRIKDKVGASR